MITGGSEAARCLSSVGCEAQAESTTTPNFAGAGKMAAKPSSYRKLILRINYRALA